MRGAIRFAPGILCAIAVAVVTASATLPGATGCATHQCDSSIECVFPSGPAPGHCIFPTTVTLTDDQLYQDNDEMVWDSAPLNGPWLDYLGNATLSIFYPPQMAAALSAIGPNAIPTSVTAWVSSDEPDAGRKANFTNASGQLAEYTYIDGHAVNVFNAGCAEYSLRVEVRLQLPPGSDAGAPPVDAAPDVGPSSGDSAADAESDAVSSPDGSAPDGGVTSVDAGSE